MKKIVVTVGISGSGKSTFAHEQWKANPTGVVVVNRDKIRELLFSYSEESIQEYYKRPDLNKLEKQVTKYEDTLINEALCEDKTVIVDATHLEKKYLTRFEYWNVLVEYKYFNIPREVAALRDSNRTRKVGAEIIKKQYEKYQNLERLDDFKPVELFNDIKLPKCVLVDIDGTLAHMGDRRSPFEWSKVGLDYVDTQIKRIVNSLQTDVFICTGRDGVCLDETIKWLDDNNIYYDKVFIRKAGDMRPDWQVKAEIWQQISKDYYIDFLIDDRMQVVRHARALGLKVLQVDYNNF